MANMGVMAGSGNLKPISLRSCNHISRRCKDLDKSIEFYRDVLGFIPLERPKCLKFPGYWLFNYGISIHLLQPTAPEDNSVGTESNSAQSAATANAAVQSTAPEDNSVGTESNSAQSAATANAAVQPTAPEDNSVGTESNSAQSAATANAAVQPTAPEDNSVGTESNSAQSAATAKAAVQPTAPEDHSVGTESNSAQSAATANAVVQPTAPEDNSVGTESNSAQSAATVTDVVQSEVREDHIGQDASNPPTSATRENQPKKTEKDLNPTDNHISFQCDDLKAAEDMLKKRKIKFKPYTLEENGIRVNQLFFHDPDGQMIELCDCENFPLQLVVCPHDVIIKKICK